MDERGLRVLLERLLRENNNRDNLEDLLNDRLYKKNINLEYEKFNNINDYIKIIDNKNKDINKIKDDLFIYDNFIDDNFINLDDPEHNPTKQAELIETFLSSSDMVLHAGSYKFLKFNESVVLASISRNLYSIVYASNITDRVKEVALNLALQNGFVITADTPLFLKSHPQIILKSCQIDINSINFVDNNLIEQLGNDFKQFMLLLAKQNAYTITENTPSFLKKDFDLVLESLKKDINLVNYIILDNFDENKQKQIINLLTEKEYTINYRTPDILRRNKDLILISARQDHQAIRYCLIDSRDIDLKDRLIKILLETNYVIDLYTPEWVKNNREVALNSISIDRNSARYVSNQLLTEPEIFKQLLFNGFYSFSKLEEMEFSALSDEELLKFNIDKIFGKGNSENDKQLLKERVAEIVRLMAQNKFSIKNLENIFRHIATNEWEKEKDKKTEYYSNIFNRIVASLEKNGNFISALAELKFLLNVDDILGDDKYALFNTFLEYHQIFHNINIPNKIAILQSYRDTISKLSALYSSKSKEGFISGIVNSYSKNCKSVFHLRADSPDVMKKIVEVKQRQMLFNMIANNDSTILIQIDNIKQKYYAINIDGFTPDEIKTAVDSIFKFIYDKKNDIAELFNKPIRYDEFERYEAISKLINRLNARNINYNDSSVAKYKHYISFKGETYSYNGDSFTSEEIQVLNKYKSLVFTYNKINGEVIKVAKGLRNYGSITNEDLISLADKVDFNDSNFEYKADWKRMQIRQINDFLRSFENIQDSIKNDDSYKYVVDLLFNRGLLSYAIFRKFYTLQGDWKQILNENEISLDSLKDILENAPKIMMLTPSNADLHTIIDTSELCKYADLRQISLLSPEVIKKIYTNNAYVSSNRKEQRIEVASKLVSEMAKRDSATVPYIDGTNGNYHYSMYDSLDSTLLTAGIDTNACFRVLGNDNDFVHYCGLDKNGFVIKLTDLEGNFIGRASGFRNGNVVYINQLRTIYDKGTNGYESESKEIIEAFTQACNDIVNISQKSEESKVDFVLVTQSYSLSNMKSNVTEAVKNHIGNTPMDHQSDDWQRFKKNSNLNESIDDYFQTDFGGYPLICVASKNNETITIDKIKSGDVPAAYKRKRSEVVVAKVNDSTEKKVNRIIALNSFLNDSDFIPIKISKDFNLAIGDNWFTIVNNNEIVQSFYLPSDDLARAEYETFVSQLNSTYVSEEQTNKKL